MASIAILHATLTHLLAQSAGARAVGLDVRKAAGDRETFRQGLATHRVDALVLGLDCLGEMPLMEIDRLQRYTRARATVVTHSFTDLPTLRALRDRDDIWLVREPVTRARLQGLLARALDEPDLAAAPPRHDASGGAPAAGSTFDDVIAQPAPARRYDDVQLNRVFEEAVQLEYEFTQHVAELLIQLDGFEAYCRRRNEGRQRSRGLHTDVARGAGHARALLEECLHRLVRATGVEPGPSAGQEEQARDAAG
jgi:hypothetical protein